MHIGLIGGIGVSATLVYYQRLTALMDAAGAKLDLTIVHAHAPDLVANNLADARDAQAQIYKGLLDRLAAAGCDCAAITSLGGHFCFAETEAISPLPLISGVTPLDAHFAANGIKTVGLLGTEVVMRTKLYGQLTQTDAVVPDDLDRVGRAYLDIALAKAATSDEAAFFDAEAQQMVTHKGAEAIVLAGTDLGLAYDQLSPNYPVFDALDVHVSLLADVACGKVALR